MYVGSILIYFYFSELVPCLFLIDRNQSVRFLYHNKLQDLEKLLSFQVEV